jgi:hypothetical protein
MGGLKMEVVVNQGSIADKRALEKASADNAAMKANLDYVAMMADVDIVTTEGADTNDMETEN